MTPEEEQSLIESARNGDVAAFEQLYRAHAGRVNGLCLRLCSNSADAQDATQETFVKAWRALRNFKGNSALSTWLHRIAFNEAMRIKKSRSGRDNHLQLVDQATRDDSATLTESEQLEQAIRRLPDRAREALVLNKLYGYTHEEAADLMGITAGASKAQVHRAIKLLRDLLGAADAANPVAAVTGPSGASFDG